MKENYLPRIKDSITKAKDFYKFLETPKGYKYTVNHDIEKYPAAVLYGTWAVACLNILMQNENWIKEKRDFTLDILKKYRTQDGLFFPEALNHIPYTKSKEYMQLHCYNYAVGAAIMLDKSFDFQSSYMDYFLEADNLRRWLDQRSMARPWEESNNIVNVVSYLALCNDHGDARGKERLYQMLEWHNKCQNPRTGGFEFFSPSRGNVYQSMAGAVHNFHIHHYLDEPMNFEEIIGQNVVQFLYEGPLTACLSIDFVELACYALPFMKNPHEVEQALLYHLDALLKYQNPDGGWYENESVSKPTGANGMKESKASSNSYGTWFRMCSLGMIAITLFEEDAENWQFRTTLGMGYFKKKGEYQMKSTGIDKAVARKYYMKNLPSKVKTELIQFGAKHIG